MITYRKAKPEDVHSALDLALRVFMEYEGPLYELQAVESLHADITLKKSKAHIYTIGNRPLFVAMDGECVVGMIDARESGHIQSMYVHGAYHRKGIATVLMSHMVCELKLRGFNRITVDSSPISLPFYKYFGFVPTDNEQKRDGFIFTPMVYEPNEIWDVLDEKGNKTGRYAERGRKMAIGDYFLIVHVWKHNGKGEWLIDRRAPRYGRGDLDGKWETTGGCAVAGDNSLTAALREAKEELGIDLDTEKGILFNRFNRRGDNGHTWFEDVWVFEYDESLETVAFDGSEVCDVMWATVEKIREMTAMGEFLGEAVYPYFDEMVEKWRAAE